jgi:hypothetical protein
VLIFDVGVKKIQEANTELQDLCIRELVGEIRKIPENLKDKYVDYLKDLGCFYVQSDEYMAEYFGPEIGDYRYGVYSFDGSCIYYKRLVIPIRGLDGSIKALCAYDNGNSFEGEFIKYQYSSKLVWDKGNYCFMSADDFRRAVTDGYILIVDGLFDKITLSILGYNAVSLMGSALTDVNCILLNFIDTKIVVPDNDQAGKKLYKTCKYKLDNVLKFEQGKEWDIDDFLKNEKGQTRFRTGFTSLMQRGFDLGLGI